MTSCDVYVYLKPNFRMEKYLLCLNKKQRFAISSYRTNSACLSKVTGRFKKRKLKGTTYSVLYVMGIS